MVNTGHHLRRKVIIICSILIDAVLVFVGAFLVLGGIWEFPFGTRIGIMLAPFMILLGGSILFVGIIVGRRVAAYIKK
jgi:hypothetical protein